MIISAHNIPLTIKICHYFIKNRIECLVH